MENIPHPCRHPRVTHPVRPPPHRRNWPKKRPRWEKYPKFPTGIIALRFYLLKIKWKNYIPKPWDEDPLAFLSSIPIGISIEISFCTELRRKVPPGQWDRGVCRKYQYAITWIAGILKDSYFITLIHELLSLISYSLNRSVEQCAILSCIWALVL